MCYTLRESLGLLRYDNELCYMDHYPRRFSTPSDWAFAPELDASCFEDDGKGRTMLVVPGFRSCRFDVVDRLQGAAPRNAEEPAPGPAHSPPIAYFRGHGTRINKDVL